MAAAVAEAGGGGGGRGAAADAANVNPEVKKLADEFQANVVKVMLERKELNEENEIITAKSLEGTKKKKRANKPNEFITNDDFCPGCGLRLKNMPEDENNFWTEDLPARTEGFRRPGRHDGDGRTRRQARRAAVPRLGPGKPRRAPKRKRRWPPSRPISTQRARNSSLPIRSFTAWRTPTSR